MASSEAILASHYIDPRRRIDVCSIYAAGTLRLYDWRVRLAAHQRRSPTCDRSLCTVALVFTVEKRYSRQKTAIEFPFVSETNYFISHWFDYDYFLEFLFPHQLHRPGHFAMMKF